ncbi:MAG: hypothetical protein HYU66_20705 [Armatimonadetes bacterium]|nr:hypothetical protein [Armatimonadota bacterium]
MRCRCQLAVVLVALAAASADPPYYHREGDWVSTHLAAREALTRFEADEAAGAARNADLVLGPWWSIGPFVAPKGESAFAIACPPESEVDLARAYNDGKLRWVERGAWADGEVHDLPSGDYSSTYLHRTIIAKAAGPLTVYLGSDDGCELFLNGQKVLSQDVPRGCAPNQVTLKLDLRAGENRLLYKIVNITGGYAFYFSTEADPGDIGGKRRAELWDLLARDFAADAEAMGWEREDGIWSEDWPAGDREALAKRYSAATRGAAWQALAAKAEGYAGPSPTSATRSARATRRRTSTCGGWRR